MAKAAQNEVRSLGVEIPNCPTCQESMSAPIYLCQTGHSLCNGCTMQLRPPVCPLCRQPMTQMRNWQLEELIETATVACPNKTKGCVYTMNNKDVQDHLKECIFREMPCPLGAVFGKCSWTGQLKALMEHFKNHHPQHCNINPGTEINIDKVSILVDDRHMYLVPQNKFVFIISFKIDTLQKMAYWTVQQIGGKKMAEQHIYEIHVTSNQDNRRKVIFSDHCFNDVLDANEIFRMGRCGIMPLAMLSHFIKDGRVTFNFHIKRNLPAIKKDKGADQNVDNKSADDKKKKPYPKGAKNFRGKSPGPHSHKS